MKQIFYFLTKAVQGHRLTCRSQDFKVASKCYPVSSDCPDRPPRRPIVNIPVFIRYNARADIVIDGMDDWQSRMSSHNY